jgi:hypothetical protein
MGAAAGGPGYEAPGACARWATILTLTDLTAGKQVELKELDPDIEFANTNECQSMVARIGPIYRAVIQLPPS